MLADLRLNDDSDDHTREVKATQHGTHPIFQSMLHVLLTTTPTSPQEMEQ